jgi:hypothetical protein
MNRGARIRRVQSRLRRLRVLSEIMPPTRLHPLGLSY